MPGSVPTAGTQRDTELTPTVGIQFVTEQAEAASTAGRVMNGEGAVKPAAVGRLEIAMKSNAGRCTETDASTDDTFDPMPAGRISKRPRSDENDETDDQHRGPGIQ